MANNQNGKQTLLTDSKALFDQSKHAALQSRASCIITSIESFNTIAIYRAAWMQVHSGQAGQHVQLPLAVPTNRTFFFAFSCFVFSAWPSLSLSLSLSLSILFVSVCLRPHPVSQPNHKINGETVSGHTDLVGQQPWLLLPTSARHPAYSVPRPLPVSTCEYTPNHRIGSSSVNYYN
jgi:hypothetical protein